MPQFCLGGRLNAGNQNYEHALPADSALPAWHIPSYTFVRTLAFLHRPKERYFMMGRHRNSGTILREKRHVFNFEILIVFIV